MSDATMCRPALCYAARRRATTLKKTSRGILQHREAQGGITQCEWTLKINISTKVSRVMTNAYTNIEQTKDNLSICSPMHNSSMFLKNPYTLNCSGTYTHNLLNSVNFKIPSVIKRQVKHREWSL